jgi:hypothetical protein
MAQGPRILPVVPAVAHGMRCVQNLRRAAAAARQREEEVAHWTWKGDAAAAAARTKAQLESAGVLKLSAAQMRSELERYDSTLTMTNKHLAMLCGPSLIMSRCLQLRLGVTIPRLAEKSDLLAALVQVVVPCIVVLPTLGLRSWELPGGALLILWCCPTLPTTGDSEELCSRYCDGYVS